MEKVRDKINRAKHEAELSNEKLAKAEVELREVIQQLGDSEKQVKELTTKNALLEHELDRVRQALGKYKEEESRNNNDGENIEALRRQLVTLGNTVTQRETQLDKKNAVIRDLESMRDEFESKSRMGISEVSKLQKELDEYKSKYESSKKELEDVFRELEEL